MSDDKQAAAEADTTIADTGALDDLSPSAEDTAYFESEGEVNDHGDAGEGSDTEGETRAQAADAGSEDDAGEGQGDQAGEDEGEGAGEAGGEVGVGGDKRQATVPHQALHAEREGHKQTKQALQQQGERMALMEDRFAQMAKMVQDRENAQQQAAQQAEIIDPEVDPWGAQVQTTQMMAKELAELKAHNEQRGQQEYANQKQNQQNQQRQGVLDSVLSEYRTSVEAEPAVETAYNMLTHSIAAQGAAHGLPEHKLAGYVTEQIQQSALYARQNGIPIGTYIKNLAGSIGWDGTIPPAGDGEQQNNGQLAGEIQESNERRARHKSLGSVPGTASVKSGTDVLKMSGKEFDHFMDNASEAAIEKAFS